MNDATVKIKIVYIFLTPGNGLANLLGRILPELESGTHSVEVLGMCFFDGNEHALDTSAEMGLRLEQIASRQGIVMMRADTSALNARQSACPGNSTPETPELRLPTECPVIVLSGGKEEVCFPDIFSAVYPQRPDHFISL